MPKNKLHIRYEPTLQFNKYPIEAMRTTSLEKAKKIIEKIARSVIKYAIWFDNIGKPIAIIGDVKVVTQASYVKKKKKKAA
jgi:hypothetical protein